MYSLFSLFGLMCIGVGAFFCSFLALRGKYNRSNISLIFLLLVLLLNLAYALSVHTGYIRFLPVFYFLINKGFIFHLLIYPLFLSFIQSYTRHEVQKFFIGILFIPPALVFLNALFQYLSADAGYAQQRVTQFLQDYRPGPGNVFRSWVLFIINIVIPGIVLTGAALELKSYFGKGILKETRLLLISLSLLMTFIFLFRLASFPIQKALYLKTGESFIAWNLEILFNSLFIIVLSSLVMMQNNLNKLGEIKLRGQTYAASSLTKNRLHELMDEIRVLMIDRKYYQVQGFSISDLSEELDINTKYLSQAINRVMGKTFPEFINSCRIERAKQLLLEDEYAHYSIEAIAKEAGFNSRSTFYRVFKNEVGMSPAEYKKKNP